MLLVLTVCCCPRTGLTRMLVVIIGVDTLDMMLIATVRVQRGRTIRLPITEHNLLGQCLMR